MSLMKKGLFVASALAVALPLAGAFAQSDDATYCQALAQQVRTVNRGADPSGEVGRALSQCQTGTPPYGVPAMEKFLTDAKVSLPARPHGAAAAALQCQGVSRHGCMPDGRICREAAAGRLQDVKIRRGGGMADGGAFPTVSHPA